MDTPPIYSPIPLQIQAPHMETPTQQNATITTGESDPISSKEIQDSSKFSIKKRKPILGGTLREGKL